MYRSSVEYIGGTASDPTHVYYNCDIINNATDDGLSPGGVSPLPDPLIRFNETRDYPLIRDASKYQFSIIRFTMNGPNRDLPLMIPVIQTGQTDVNRTTYAVAIPFQQSFQTNLGVTQISALPAPRFIQYVPETQNPLLAPSPRPPTLEQDLGTRYYWIYTYGWWNQLVNATLELAYQDTYAAFQAAWAAYPGLTTPFPYASYAAWVAATGAAPKMTYEGEEPPIFSIWGDSKCFGTPLTAFVPPGAPVPGDAVSAPSCRLFFNTNMYGLYANFPNKYWNTSAVSYYPGAVVPVGYVNEILFDNKQWSNIVDYTGLPYSGFTGMPADQKTQWWIAKQDFPSVDSLWSPIGSIVFTTTLLPIKTEAVGEPVVFGRGNLGDSAPTSRSAFQPIITDIALADNFANNWREFIVYNPTAEYRLSDFTGSAQEVRNFDIQVFWKNRLNNELYPISMFNLSSVSLKVLFRRKDI
jgi:hypothetical protein